MRKHSTMGTWRLRKMKKGLRASRTTGKSKGIIATPLERTICRRNRSYKHPSYALIMSKMKGEKRIMPEILVTGGSSVDGLASVLMKIFNKKSQGELEVPKTQP